MVSINSTRPPTPRQSPAADPEPGYYCQGMTIPLEVIDHIGTPVPHPTRDCLRFTDAHALLIGYVGMMVGWKGRGCWASNRKLAGLLNKTERRVEQLVRDCKHFGFVRDHGVQDIDLGGGRTVRRRVLDTKWNPARDPGDPKLVSGERPKLVSGKKRNTRKGLGRPDRCAVAAPPAVRPRPKPIKETFTHQPGTKHMPADQRRRRDSPFEIDEASGLPNRTMRPSTPPAEPAAAPPPPARQPPPPAARPAADDELTGVPKSPNDKKPRCATTPQDEARAVRLRAAVIAAGVVVTAFSKRKWADQMHYMADELVKQGKDPAQIDALLTWMEREKPTRPSIGTAAEFRKQVRWLTDLMNKGTPPPAAADPADDPPAVKWFIRAQLNHGWPPGVEDAIPDVVRRSMAAVDAFHARVAAAAVPRDLEPVRKAVAAETADAEYAVEQWLYHARHFACEKEGWRGPFPAWRPDEYSVLKLFRAAADRETGDGRDYDRLLKEVACDRTR